MRRNIAQTRRPHPKHAAATAYAVRIISGSDSLPDVLVPTVFDVELRAKVTPATIALGEIPVGRPRQFSVSIASRDEQPLQVRLVSAPSAVSCELHARPSSRRVACNVHLAKCRLLARCDRRRSSYRTCPGDEPDRMRGTCDGLAAALTDLLDALNLFPMTPGTRTARFRRREEPGTLVARERSSFSLAQKP